MGNKSNYLKLLDKPDKIIEMIEKNPVDLFKFYYSLLKENSYYKNNLEIFEYNIKKLYNIILNLNESYNKDFYISLSCIFGAFFFDSCGSHCEFSKRNYNNHYYIYEKENPQQYFKNGQITDDSEMAISRAFAIMDSKYLSTLNTDNIFYYYGVWFNLQPLDIGLTTQNALMLFDKEKMILNGNANDNFFFNNKIKNMIANFNKKSLANGGLMKISTLIVWFFYVYNSYIKNILYTNNPKKEELFELYSKIYIEVEKDIIITHPNEENIIACSIFVFLTLSIMCENNGKKTIKFVLLLLENGIFENDINSKKVKKLIIQSLIDFENKNFDINSCFIDVYTHMGYYVHAFKLSLFYLSKIDNLLLKKEKDKIFIKIIEEICDLGGDTDTNGAIVGTLIGPIIGYKNFYDKNIKSQSGLFETFLKFFDKKRIIYTSSLMYYYVDFLEKNCKNLYNNSHMKINNEYYVLNLFLNLLNK